MCIIIKGKLNVTRSNSINRMVSYATMHKRSTIYRVLRNSRIPLFLHRKSNHVFSVWQHIVLLTVRQYEGKSYRMFVEWLVEAYYLRMFMQLSHIPHYTTLQKFAARISGTILGRIISSFILLLSNIRRLFIGIYRFIRIQSIY